MKQSVVAPGRLASAHSVRTGRRNSAGIAEKTSVGISFGGVSRYIIFLVHPCWNGRTINDVLRAVDWLLLILRSAKRVSKDGGHIRATWFETALTRLLTMRGWECQFATASLRCAESPDPVCAISRFSSGMQEPQLVPALSLAPMSAAVR